MADGSISLFRFSAGLLRPFWPIALMATVMGALSGIATAWLLATINAALHAEGGAPPSLLWAFAGLCALAVAGEVISDLGNSYVGQRVVATLRKDLVGRIIAAPIDELERFRSHRLMATLNQDVETISGFTFAFSSLAIALAVTLGSFAYLVLLSPAMAAAAGAAVAAGSLVHVRARRAARRNFEAARGAQDELQKHYRAITDGAKELRISRERRRRVHSRHLVGTIDRICRLRVRAMRIFMSANAFGSILFFVVIGVLFAFRDRFGAGGEALSGFVLVLLYVRGPLQQLIAALPAMGQAQVALRHVALLSRRFASPEAPGLLGEGPPPPGSVGRIELRGVTYAFPAADGGDPFVLGPIDLTIRPGEILFVVGENGSGKTTLVKLILGLYAPHRGAVLCDGAAVDAGNRDGYRQLFSAIFFDYFLFDEVIAPGGLVPDRAAAYLDRLEIAHKAAIRDGRFTTTELSAGQRKRLALIQVYLEGRPVVVFDEWAAEQDPTFRRLFYDELLPDLKAEGKTLIVISHDDRYFGAADRIVRMEGGVIVETRENVPEGAADA